MRLINTTTGRFQDFFDTLRPSYAILSHTWGSREMSYLDVLFLTSDMPANALGVVHTLLRNPSKESDGYRKVEACCNLARSRGFEWVWIDSCCIDKSSSAELSEAINSMWSWYRDAAECLVYLFDVVVTAEQLRENQEAMKLLGRSRWFTRGWTLQELLAPNRVVFCNSSWQILAQKKEIARWLSSITKIPLVFLDGTYDPADCKTTRTEDMAYCMLGLFNVSMPLIYGEGRKSFMRLQLEIIKRVDDDSIYAWTSDVDKSGLLATWPTAFANSGNLVQIEFPADNAPWLPATMTSIGLEMKARIARNDPHQRDIDARHGVYSLSMAMPRYDRTGLVMHCSPCNTQVAPITQHWTPRDVGDAFVIELRRFGNTWQRVNCRKLDFVKYVYGSGDEAGYVVYHIEQQGL